MFVKRDIDLIEKEIPINKPPVFFKSGSLVFEESGHTITRDGKSYVCAKKQKSQCNEDEPRISSEVLERQFSRLAVKFRIPQDYREDMLKNCYAEPLKWLIDFSIKRQSERKKEDYQYLSVVGIIVTISLVFGDKNLKERELGRSLGILCEKIYIDKKGKIKGIKLSSVGEYVINFLISNIWSYSSKIPLNTLREFKLDTSQDVEKDLNKKEIEEIKTIEPFYTGYITFSLFEKLFEKIKDMDNEGIGEILQEFFLSLLPEDKLPKL